MGYLCLLERAESFITAPVIKPHLVCILSSSGFMELLVLQKLVPIDILKIPNSEYFEFLLSSNLQLQIEDCIP